MKKNYSLLFILIILCAAAAGAYYFFGSDDSMSTIEMSDFAVEDASEVTQFVITTMSGESASLKKDADTGIWMLNDKYRARESAVDLVVESFEKIEVRTPVAKGAQKSVLANMAAGGTRIDIYIKDQLNKSYILGTSAKDHYGSHMLLEKPSEGRSAVPYIVHIKGFSGFLNPRYFTDENEWRYTGVFEYPNLDFNKVEFTDHQAGTNSFEIEYNGGNDIKVRSPYIDAYLNRFDTLMVKDYLLRFKKVHIETFQNYLSQSASDSITITRPNYTISLTDNTGKTKAIDLYHFLEDDGEGNMVPNGDRMYGKFENGEIALAQRYTFDPLIRSLNEFIP